MRNVLLSLAFVTSTLTLGFSAPAVAGGYDGARDSDNRPHGWGVYVYPGGGRYEGQWQFGEKAGRGIREWRDGSRYDGQWQHNMPHGKGVMTYADGGTYRGEFKAGKRAGRGVETLVDGSVYSGEFRFDVRHGTGRLERHDGSRYDGSWVRGVQQGQGLWVMADGSAFRGSFVAGKADGKGECVVAGKTSPCRYEHGKIAPTAVAMPVQVADAVKPTGIRALRARSSLVPPPQGTAAVKAARAAASTVARLDTQKEPADGEVVAAPSPEPVPAIALPAPEVAIAHPEPSEPPVAPVTASNLSLQQQLDAQGSGLFLEHDVPRLTLAGAASHGWWRKSVALFGGGLEVIVVKGKERLLLRIPSYKGPGIYAGDDFTVSLIGADDRFLSTGSEAALLTIESDESGWITGRLESVELESSADGSAARLARGVFRLADQMPQVASALTDY